MREPLHIFLVDTRKMSSSPITMQAVKCMAMPTFIVSCLNTLNGAITSLGSSWQGTSMAFGGILMLIASGQVLCTSQYSGSSIDRQRLFQQLACARCSGTAALMMMCISILSWGQVTSQYYACAATEGCASLPLPKACDMDACEVYTGDVWKPDADCRTPRQRSRCVGGLEHFVSEEPYGACEELTCCSTQTTPPPAFISGTSSIDYVCSRRENEVGSYCQYIEQCQQLAPISAVVSCWAFGCAVLYWIFLRRVIVTSQSLRSTFFDGPTVRDIQMAHIMGAASYDMQRTRRESSGRGDVEGGNGPVQATPISDDVPTGVCVAGVPVTSAEQMVVVTGIAVPSGAPGAPAAPGASQAVAAAEGTSGGSASAGPVIARPINQA